ncbi:hypothetical protein BH23CHL10_BH23CHL10_10790 [soil metagenome]
MLETLLSGDWTIGSNASSRTPGAGWVFLLSSVDLGTVVTIGTVAPATRRMLETIAARVVELDLGSDPPEPTGIDLVLVPAGRRAPPRWTGPDLGPRRWFFEEVDDAPAELLAIGTRIAAVWDERFVGAAPADDRVRRATLDQVSGARTRLMNRVRGRRLRTSLLVDAAGGGHGRLPEYLAAAMPDQEASATRPTDWLLTTSARYPSQKAVMRVYPTGAEVPSAVIKLPMDPLFNRWLDVEYCLLQAVRTGGDLVDRVPAPTAISRAGRRTLLVENAVPGVALERRDLHDTPGGARSQAMRFILALGAATRRSISGAEAADALDEVVVQFFRGYVVSPDEHRRIRALLTTIRRSASFPIVMQHGDPGAWNLLRRPDGGITFLDWEAGELAGVPLWDLLHLQRSWSLARSRRLRPSWQLASFHRAFLRQGGEARLIRGEIDEYVRGMEIDPTVVEPLFHLCWLARALKELSRLAPVATDRGQFRRVLGLTLRSREIPVLSDHW